MLYTCIPIGCIYVYVRIHILVHGFPELLKNFPKF